MFASLKKTARFLKDLSTDERIPARDKAVIGGLLAYLANPVDLIPDFIPIIGYLDDLFVAAVVLDYVFHVLPEEVIMDHFPWPREKYRSIKRRTRFVSFLVPGPLKRRIWQAKGTPKTES